MIAIPQYFGFVGDDPTELYFSHGDAPFLGFQRRYIIGSGCEERVVAIPCSTVGISLSQSILNDMSGLDADWEAIGSDAPNDISKHLALRILDRSFLMDRVRPSYATASAEGGVGIVYRSQDRYAAIECLNSGTMWLLWYDEQGNPRSREVEDNTVAIETALDQVSALHADA